MSKYLRSKTGRIILSGLAGCALATLAAQAEDTNAPTVLKPTVVTGSYIPTAETVGVAPVDVIGSQAIEKVGTQDVLETLKKTTPVFAGNGNYGQSVNNGGVGEAYIAVRNLPTLVLLDGRRLVNSAFSSGTAVDVNAIPIAMIERIEVLKDGASALYGSDAIGGVVNIITKKNWNGAEIGGRYGFATGKGSVTEQRAYVTGGTTTDRASFSAGAQYYAMDPLYAKDRKVASMDAIELLNAGVFPASYISPSYPGRVESGGVSYILAGSPFAVGAPGYNPAITKPPVDLGVQYPTVADYLVAHPGVYIPIASTPIGQAIDQAYRRIGYTGEQAAWPLINTALYGVPSIMGQDRREFIANGTYDLLDDKRMTLFSEFLFADTVSEGALAGSPMSSLGNANITIAADSPVNPFQIALGANGASSPRVRSRFLDLGSRVYRYSTDTYQFRGGLRGDLGLGWDVSYEAAFNYGRSKALQQMINSPNGAALQLATTANTDPALAALGLSQLYDVTGPVPLYNPFALPGKNNPRTLEMLRATGYTSADSQIWGADARFNGNIPFELPAGKIGWALGGGFYRESLSSDVDPLTQLGQLIGQNQSYRMPSRYRDAYNGFIETRIPVTSPNMDLPGLYSFEITAAGRYETFDPGGDDAVPKVGFRWQPFDEEVTIRGSYSQSFLAPSVYNLYGSPAVSYDYVTAGGIGQVQMNWVSNPDLKPAEAETWTVGLVLSPKFVPGLTVSADYYHITTENDVYRVGAQAVVNSLNQLGSASPFASSFLFSDYRTRLTTTAPNQITVGNWGVADRPFFNGAEQRTDGFDLSANYLLPLEPTWGKVNIFANCNVLLNYDYKDPDIGGYYPYAGQYTDSGPSGGAQGNLPDFTLVTGLTWDIYDFTYTVNTRFIPQVDDLGDMHPSVGSPVNDYTLNGKKWEIPAWFSIDMQLAYQLKSEGKWYNNTRLAIGVNNVTDEDPPLIASSTEDNTDKSTYDILGRFIYFEISKKF